MSDTVEKLQAALRQLEMIKLIADSGGRRIESAMDACDKIFEICCVDIATLSQPVADGWKGLEVTNDMIDAAMDAAEGWFEVDGDKGAWLRSQGWEAAFKAMLAAAPASPVMAVDSRDGPEEKEH